MSDAPRIPTDAAPLEHGRMPLLGLGTWPLKGEECVTAVRAALEAGYRHLDTATRYENEAEVGRGLAESGVTRGEVFVTTKWPGDDDPGTALDTLRRSLDALGTEYVDLWLVHWPGEGRRDVWHRFVQAREQGLARDIGVSNFDLEMIDQAREDTGVQPSVNQVKWNPMLFDSGFLAGHRERGVVLEGYSALRYGAHEDPTVRRVAERHGATPVQVLVRWHLQHGVVVIPKSANPDRIRSNADVDWFVLGDDDMAALDALSTVS
jgi:diketogulonate reductase-like aldo/keto reductase